MLAPAQSYAFDQVGASLVTSDGERFLSLLWSQGTRRQKHRPRPAAIVAGADGVMQWGTGDGCGAALRGDRLAVLTPHRLGARQDGVTLTVLSLPAGTPLAEHVLGDWTAPFPSPWGGLSSMTFGMAWAGADNLVVATADRGPSKATQGRFFHVGLDSGLQATWDYPLADEPAPADVLAGLKVDPAADQRQVWLAAIREAVRRPDESDDAGPLAVAGVEMLAAAPDGSVVVAAVDSTALLWKGRRKPVRVRALGLWTGILDVAVSAGGAAALVSSARVDFRDPAGRRVSVFKPNWPAISRVAACPTSQRFVTVEPVGTVYVFDDRQVRIGSIHFEGSDKHRLTGGLAWRPDGGLIAAGSPHGAVMLLDGLTGEPVRQVNTDQPVHDVHFLAGGSGLRLLVRTATGMGVLDCDDDAQSAPVQLWPETPTAIAVHPDGRRVATGRADGTVQVRTVGADGSVTAETDVGQHFGPVRALAWTHDRLLVGSGRAGYSGSVLAYDWPADGTA